MYSPEIWAACTEVAIHDTNNPNPQIKNRRMDTFPLRKDSSGIDFNLETPLDILEGTFPSNVA
jgi:hypothetical protein